MREQLKNFLLSIYSQCHTRPIMARSRSSYTTRPSGISTQNNSHGHDQIAQSKSDPPMAPLFGWSKGERDIFDQSASTGQHAMENSKASDVFNYYKNKPYDTHRINNASQAWITKILQV